MKTSTIVAIILFVGVAFNLIGRANAVELDCTPVEPGVAFNPVCLDIPQGPRFTMRR